MEQYPVLDFDPVTAKALDVFVKRYADAVIKILSDAAIDERIASICISPGTDGRMETLPMIYAGRAADRDRVVRERPGDWVEAWNPFALRDEEDLVHPIFVSDEADEHVKGQYVGLPTEVVAAWETVRGSLEGRCLDPEYWVHVRVAHHLNRQPLPIPATPDLAVWVFDFDAGQGELLEMLTAVLRPDTFAMLQASGLIGEDEEAAHGG